MNNPATRQLLSHRAIVLIVAVLCLGTYSSIATAQKPAHEMSWQEVYEGSFNRENFTARSLKAPAKIKSVFDRVEFGATQFMQALAQQQSQDRTLHEHYLKSGLNRREFYQLHLAHGMVEEDYSTDIDERFLTEHFEKSSQDVAKSYVDTRVENWLPFHRGLDFDLGMSKNDPSAQPAKPRDPIRYGLALKRIDTSDRRLNIAAISPDPFDSLAYASKGEVEWTIAPNSNDPAADPLEAQVPDSLYEPEPPRQTLNSSAENGSIEQSYHGFQRAYEAPEAKFWKRFDIPSPQFKGKVTPAGKLDFKALRQGGLPGARLRLDQEDGLYALDYVTDEKFDAETVRHTVALPVAGAMHVRRIYDENWKTQRSELNDILVHKHLPSLSFARDHLVEKYSALLMVTKPKENFRFSFHTPENWSPDDSLGRKGEKYEVQYDWLF